MNKVFQQFVDRDKGDCMQASVATLLSLPYEDVPKFIEFENWFEHFYNLLVKHGYKYKGMLHNPLDKTNVYEECFVAKLKDYNGVNGYFLASVYSPKYFAVADFMNRSATTHAVIIDKDFNIVHDPNPGNKDVKEYPMAKELCYNGIIHITLIE